MAKEKNGIPMLVFPCIFFFFRFTPETFYLLDKSLYSASEWKVSWWNTKVLRGNAKALKNVFLSSHIVPITMSLWGLHTFPSEL